MSSRACSTRHTLVPQTKLNPEALQDQAPAMEDVEGTEEWVMVFNTSTCCIIAIATAKA